MGKTPRSTRATTTLRKHPHGRGEDEPQPARCDSLGETPPRAWGRRYYLNSDVTDAGNTPTGVGKTYDVYSTSEYNKKHPHGRGEDVPAHRMNRPDRETPPRAWGRLKKRNTNPSENRNTPTGVGKTPGEGVCVKTVWKHPHGRGEDAGPSG